MVGIGLLDAEHQLRRSRIGPIGVLLNSISFDSRRAINLFRIVYEKIAVPRIVWVKSKAEQTTLAAEAKAIRDIKKWSIQNAVVINDPHRTWLLDHEDAHITRRRADMKRRSQPVRH